MQVQEGPGMKRKTHSSYPKKLICLFLFYNIINLNLIAFVAAFLLFCVFMKTVSF